MGLHSKPTSSRASNIRRVGRQSSFALIAAAVVGLHKALNFAENFIPSSRPTRAVSAVDRRQVWTAIAGGLAASTLADKEASAQVLPGTQALAGRAGGRGPSFGDISDEERRKLIKEAGPDLGRVMRLKNQCFEADKDGKTAQIGPRVIVWDKDAGCAEGQVYIHAAGKGKFISMTSAAGSATHTFAAKTMEDKDIEEYADKVGQCYKPPSGGEEEVNWQIANIDRGAKC